MKYIFGDKYLIFAEDVEKTFNSYRQIKKEQHEAGGILLGKIYKDKVLIEEISRPSTEDKSGRYFFQRCVKKAQRIVNEAWQRSGGELIYLGEWHTHPEAVPTPSPDDKKLIASMLRDSKMEIDFLFMVIIGTKGNYVAYQQSRKFTQLKCVE